SPRRRRTAGRAGRPARWRWPPGPGAGPFPCSPRASGSGPGRAIPAPPGPAWPPEERFGAVGSPHQVTRNNFCYYGYRVELSVGARYALDAIYRVRYSEVVRRVEYPQFTDWMQRLPRDVFIAVEADIRYLLEFGRSAVLPSARLRIQQSEHFPDMAETRTDIVDDSGRRWVVRTLAVFAAGDSLLAFCVAGDKSAWA